VTDIFSNIVLKAISDYKLLLRRILPAKECSAKIVGMGIKRTQLRNIDDVGLYNVALQIVENLEEYVTTEGKENIFYSGAEEFLRYLKRLLNEYHVDGNKIIHAAQSASCAMVDAIQLIALPEHRHTIDVVEKLIKSIHIVARHGSKDQLSMFIDIIKKHERHLMDTFRRNGRIFRFDEFFTLDRQDK